MTIDTGLKPEGARRLRGALLATMVPQEHSSELTRPVEMIADFLRRQQEPVDGADLTRMPLSSPTC
jgi:hypothetical protein